MKSRSVEQSPTAFQFLRGKALACTKAQQPRGGWRMVRTFARHFNYFWFFTMSLNESLIVSICLYHSLSFKATNPAPWLESGEYPQGICCLGNCFVSGSRARKESSSVEHHGDAEVSVSKLVSYDQLWSAMISWNLLKHVESLSCNACNKPFPVSVCSGLCDLRAVMVIGSFAILVLAVSRPKTVPRDPKTAMPPSSVGTCFGEWHTWKPFGQRIRWYKAWNISME